MNKKKIIIITICTILVICGVVISIILLNNKQEKETLLLNDNLNVEINSEVKLLSFVNKDNKVKIISADENVDTSTLGEQELKIKYLDNNKEKEYIFKIVVIDTEKPTIEYQKEITTTEGNKIDLLKDVKVSDNSKEDIQATIEGEYDINKVGTYNLKYVAEDSSKNKVEEEFSLIVNEKPKETSNTNNQTQKSTNTNSNKSSNNTSNNTDSGKTFEQAYADSQVYVDYAVQLLNANLNRYSTSPMSYDNKYPGKVELIMRDANFWWECDEYGLWSFRSDSQTSKKDPKSTTFAKMMSETPKPSTCNPGEKSQIYHYYFFNSYVVSY